MSTYFHFPEGTSFLHNENHTKSLKNTHYLKTSYYNFIISNKDRFYTMEILCVNSKIKILISQKNNNPILAYYFIISNKDRICMKEISFYAKMTKKMIKKCQTLSDCKCKTGTLSSLY